MPRPEARPFDHRASTRAHDNDWYSGVASRGEGSGRRPSPAVGGERARVKKVLNFVDKFTSRAMHAHQMLKLDHHANVFVPPTGLNTTGPGAKVTRPKKTSVGAWKLVPTYGNYGGPQWSAGKWGGDPRAKGAPKPIDQLDEAFRVHDVAYANPRRNDRSIRIADEALMLYLASYVGNPTNALTNPKGFAYASAALAAFAGKSGAHTLGYNIGTVRSKQNKHQKTTKQNKEQKTTKRPRR